MRHPDVLLRVDEDAGDRAHDPVIGHFLRPGRIDLECRRVGGGLGLFGCRTAGQKDDRGERSSGQEFRAEVVHARKNTTPPRASRVVFKRLSGVRSRHRRAVVGSTRVARARRERPRRRGRSRPWRRPAIANATGSSAETSNSRRSVTRVNINGARQADRQSDDNGQHDVTNDQRQDVIRARAERHADADLAALLRDGVRRRRRRARGRRAVRRRRQKSRSARRVPSVPTGFVPRCLPASGCRPAPAADRSGGRLHESPEPPLSGRRCVCTDSLTCMRGACAIGT